MGERTESLLKQLIGEHFPKLEKELDIPVQEANRTTHYLNAKRPSLTHCIKVVNSQ